MQRVTHCTTQTCEGTMQHRRLRSCTELRHARQMHGENACLCVPLTRADSASPALSGRWQVVLVRANKQA